MPHTASNLAKWAIDLQDGKGMRVLSPQPADKRINYGTSVDIKMDSRENVPQFYSISLMFNFLTQEQVQRISRLWDPTKQEIILNYPSAHALGKGAADGGWVKDTAIWRDPPVAVESGDFRGMTLFNVTITLYRVQWDGAQAPGYTGSCGGFGASYWGGPGNAYVSPGTTNAPQNILTANTRDPSCVGCNPCDTVDVYWSWGSHTPWPGVEYQIFRDMAHVVTVDETHLNTTITGLTPGVSTNITVWVVRGGIFSGYGECPPLTPPAC